MTWARRRRRPGPLPAFAVAAWLAPHPAAAQTPGADGDARVVQAVCGRCHAATVFLGKPRSWARWNDVFADMVRRGATGSDEQLARVTRYFLENLTVVNVNTSPADEIGPALGVSWSATQAIVDRRMRRPFASLAELAAVPGVDAAALSARRARIRF